MRRIKMTLEYIGTSYSGWQRQPGQDTVQQRVEDALKALTGVKTSVTASGRTDAGVHALGQVAHFDTDSGLSVKNFMTGLNHFLPAYCLYESPFDRAVYLNRAVRVAERLDLSAMRNAAEAFIGEHDFTSFMSTGADTKTSVRTVKSLKIVRSGGLVKIYVTANGFLYNMVRLMAGALVRAGVGAVDRTGIEELIALRDKNAVREVMPAAGLYLVAVKYR